MVLSSQQSLYLRDAYYYAGARCQIFVKPNLLDKNLALSFELSFAVHQVVRKPNKSSQSLHNSVYTVTRFECLLCCFNIFAKCFTVLQLGVNILKGAHKFYSNVCTLNVLCVLSMFSIAYSLCISCSPFTRKKSGKAHAICCRPL